jgi:hypothetical protein
VVAKNITPNKSSFFRIPVKAPETAKAMVPIISNEFIKNMIFTLNQSLIKTA